MIAGRPGGVGVAVLRQAQRDRCREHQDHQAKDYEIRYGDGNDTPLDVMRRASARPSHPSSLRAVDLGLRGPALRHRGPRLLYPTQSNTTRSWRVFVDSTVQRGPEDR